MAEQLEKVGLGGDARVRFFDAVRPADRGRFGSIGANGCFLSHLEVLRECAGSSVLILEDDCDFAPSVSEYRLPADFDIFYGGFLQASDPANLETSDIIGSHCMGFTTASTGTVIRYLERLLAGQVEADARATEAATFDPEVLPPIDGAYVWFRRAHPHLKTVFAHPQIALQRPSRSDIGELHFYDRLPGLRGVAEWARRAKRSITGINP